GLGGLSLGVNNIDLTRRWDYLPGYFDQPWLLEWRVFNTGMRLPQTIMKCEPISDAPIDPIAIMGIALKFADFTLEVVNGLDTNQIVIRDADGKTAFSTPTDIEPGVGWSSGCF
ncbi:MAG: hypothetical protein FWE48_06235, partial [Coriobacteriia bacterium]|nr:hypothetical protein [Coriobacteriia bacterium]